MNFSDKIGKKILPKIFTSPKIFNLSKETNLLFGILQSFFQKNKVLRETRTLVFIFKHVLSEAQALWCVIPMVPEWQKVRTLLMFAIIPTRFPPENWLTFSIKVSKSGKLSISYFQLVLNRPLFTCRRSIDILIFVFLGCNREWRGESCLKKPFGILCTDTQLPFSVEMSVLFIQRQFFWGNSTR